MIDCGFNRLAVAVEHRHVAEQVGQRCVGANGDEPQHPGAVGGLEPPFVGAPATPREILQVKGSSHS